MLRGFSHPLVLGGGLGPLAIVLSSCIPPATAAVQSPSAMSAGPSHDAEAHIAALPVHAEIRIDADDARQGGVLRGVIVPANGSLTLDGQHVTVAPDGGFLIGFDRDAGADAVLTLLGTGFATVTRHLAVTPGSWAIQRIDAPLRGSATSDADFDRRRPAEIAQMATARRMVVVSDGWRQQFIWPAHARISGVFGSQRIYRGVPANYHNGVDIAAAAGTPYVAPADGVVILAADAPFTLEGNLLMIDHGGGLSSVFLHASQLFVHTGDHVVQGQRLGAVGMTGRATGPHLHWAMRWQGAKIDPQPFVGPMTPR